PNPHKGRGKDEAGAEPPAKFTPGPAKGATSDGRSMCKKELVGLICAGEREPACPRVGLIQAQRTGRRLDGRQSPADVARMVVGDEQRAQGDKEAPGRAARPADLASATSKAAEPWTASHGRFADSSSSARRAGQVRLRRGFPWWPHPATRTARAYAPRNAT